MPDISKFKLYVDFVDFLNFGTVDLKGISSLFRQVCYELTTINYQFDDLSSAYYNLIYEFDTTGSIILGCAGAIFLGAEIIILLSATENPVLDLQNVGKSKNTNKLKCKEP